MLYFSKRLWFLSSHHLVANLQTISFPFPNSSEESHHCQFFLFDDKYLLILKPFFVVLIVIAPYLFVLIISPDEGGNPWAIITSGFTRERNDWGISRLP